MAPKPRASVAGLARACASPVVSPGSGRNPLAKASLVIIVVTDFHILECTNRIVGEYCHRVIEADQILGYRPVVDPHGAYREARHDLTGEPGFVQSDHPLACLANPHQQDACQSASALRASAAVDHQLVTRNRRDAAARAFAPKRGDGARMG